MSNGNKQLCNKYINMPMLYIMKTVQIYKWKNPCFNYNTTSRTSQSANFGSAHQYCCQLHLSN